MPGYCWTATTSPCCLDTNSVVFFWPRWAVFNRRLKLRMIPGGDPEEGDKGAAWAGCNKKRRCKHIGCAENRRAKCARTLSLAIEKVCAVPIRLYAVIHVWVQLCWTNYLEIHVHLYLIRNQVLTTFSSLLPDLLEKTRTFGNPRPRETPWKPPLVVAPLTEVVHTCARRIAMKVHVVSVRPRQGGLLVKKWISSLTGNGWNKPWNSWIFWQFFFWSLCLYVS